MTHQPNSDTPDVALTLDQLEAEVADNVAPLRMDVRGKIIELQSPMDMEAGAFSRVMDALNSSKMLGEMGEVAAVVQLLPAMIGEENYQTLVDAKISLKALIKLQEKVEAYYDEALAAAGVDDPKGSTSH